MTLHGLVVNLRKPFAMASSNWLAVRCNTASRTGFRASDASTARSAAVDAATASSDSRVEL
jgi:hypothetical protein